jgi:predicted 2-oxoglutarate/Fe(II)-dependent dioxygenase YbiX|tara:strand:+ start:2228 stop:2887 length:660 start_codon:yes stop_codon:yes gene_type:complete
MDILLGKILIQHNVVTKEGCKYLTDYVKRSPKDKMGVYDGEKSNKIKKEEQKVDTKIRDVLGADIYPIINEVKDLYDDIVNNIINPFYQFKIKDSEIPQFLYYTKGGHYKPHYDGEGLWTNPDGTQQWKKTIDRDLSTILFLNDDFEGGEFVFPAWNISIKPEPGLLVAFPSTHHYLHGVQPVISGERVTSVCWMRVEGVPTKEEQDREISEKYGIQAF